MSGNQSPGALDSSFIDEPRAVLDRTMLQCSTKIYRVFVFLNYIIKSIYLVQWYLLC